MDKLISLESAIKALTGWETDPTDEEIEYTLRKLATDKNVGTNDTINRQQTIDAVTDELNMIDHVPQWVFDRLEGRLRQLPPAQPEQHLEEWCDSCKEYDKENRCCPRWTKVIRQTRRELQDEFVMTAVDGTLCVTVDDVQKVGRVIVDEDKSKF